LKICLWMLLVPARVSIVMNFINSYTLFSLDCTLLVLISHGSVM